MKRLLLPLMLLAACSLFAFRSGERLTFDIKYGFVKAGTATIEVRDTTYYDTLAYVFTSRARTNSIYDGIYRVRDHIESIWSKRDHVSLRFTKRMNEGHYRQWRINHYYPDKGYGLYRQYNFKKAVMRDRKNPIQPNTQDILSAFYMLRTMSLSVGDVKYFNVSVDGKSYRAVVVVHRVQTINTIFGPRSCLVVEPYLKGEALFHQTGKILIYLTNDANKTPVRLESEVSYGKFTADLKEARNVP